MASKSKKKKQKSLLILFGCIIICASGYAALSVYDANKEKAEEDAAANAEKIELLSVTRDDITGISFENETDSMELLLKDDKWKDKEDKKFPVNTENADEMADALTGLTAIRLVTDSPEDISEYGLDKPVITVSVTTEKGEDTLFIGDESPSEDAGYYCYLNDSTAVYEIDSAVVAPFGYSKAEMMVLEDTPDITSSQITKLAIDHATEFDFTASNEAVGDSSTWSIREPYEQPVAGNESNLTTFLGNFETFAYEGAVEYDCGDFSKYGLDKKKPATAAIRLEYYELVEVEKTDESEAAANGEESEDTEEAAQERVDYEAKIIIGKQNDDGAYYVRVNDSSYVYLMSEDDVDGLIPDDSYTYVEPTISRISVDNMTKIQFATPEKEYELTSKEKTTTNEDGEEETETDYFFNNKTMGISEFNAITTSWSTLSTAKEMTAKQKKQVDEADVVLTADIKSQGNHQLVKFIRFDKSFYAVKDGENLLFLADKRNVDAFIEKLEAQDTK